MTAKSATRGGLGQIDSQGNRVLNERKVAMATPDAE